MSARATRPRSRRGRHAPPGELDPVAESSEEAEAAGGSSEPGPVPSQESFKPKPPGPEAEARGQGLGGRPTKEAEENSNRGPAPSLKGPHGPAEEGHQATDVAPRPGELVPPRPGASDVFQILQHALSSLEAAAAAWHRRPPSCPGPVEAEDRSEAGPKPCLEEEGAGACQREAARLAERNAWLRLALGSREEELIRVQASVQAIQAERETLQREVQELQDSLMRLEPFPLPSRGQAGGSGSGSSSSGVDEEPWGTQDPFSLAHPLLRRLRSDSSTQMFGPLRHRFLPGRSIEKLKCFNHLLSAVLQGYKGRCEALSMQLGQREAEATALRLALQYSEHCEEAYGVLLTLREADSGAREEAPMRDLEVAEKEAQRLLAHEEAAMDGGPLFGFPVARGQQCGSAHTTGAGYQLWGYVQRLQERRALVKIPPEPGPTLAPMPAVPHAEAMVPTRLEKMQIQRDLAATRVHMGSGHRVEAGLELKDAALRAQGPAHVLLLEQLRWEQAQLQTGGANSSGGDSSGGGEQWRRRGGPPAVLGGSRGIDGGKEDWMALAMSSSLLTPAPGLSLREQLQSLREELEQVVQKGRARRAQSAELNNDLCKPIHPLHALVLAFRGAHRKVALMEVRQAEELEVLEATVRALGRPRPSCPPPRLGETFL
uniref:USH1 protein network component harmonin binding protein 1 n=1 Tax=Lynx canadensis TaxID=61383 RepID=A0A667FVM0_LYNCA